MIPEERAERDLCRSVQRGGHSDRSSALNWALVTVREVSIKLYAGDVATSTKGLCSTGKTARCVTPPIGRTPTQMAAGFNPEAPGFDTEADVMAASEVF